MPLSVKDFCALLEKQQNKILLKTVGCIQLQIVGKKMLFPVFNPGLVHELKFHLASCAIFG
jgi:hypothetical protein